MTHTWLDIVDIALQCGDKCMHVHWITKKNWPNGSEPVSVCLSLRSPCWDCCLLFAAAASLVVRIHPERVLSPQGGSVTLRCQVSGSAPHYFYWSRQDGRPISSSTLRRRQGRTTPPPDTDLQTEVQGWIMYWRDNVCVCVFRSRAVLPQCPAHWRWCLHLYLPRSAQHQPQSCWDCCHKWVFVKLWIEASPGQGELFRWY